MDYVWTQTGNVPINLRGSMTYPFGIDVSSYQANKEGTLRVNFDTMMSASNPPTFIGIRSGQGLTYKDPQYAYHWAKAGENSLPKIAYHVLEFGSDGKSQAEMFFARVKAHGFTQYDRLCLDLEVAWSFTPNQITLCTLKAINRLAELTGRFPLCYSRASWMDQHLIMSMIPKVDWWLAQYKYALPWPLFTTEFNSALMKIPIGVERSQIKIHQTAEKGNGGQYGAVSHYIDYDRFLGVNLLDWFGLGEEEPDPEPPIIVDPTNPLYQVRVTEWATPHVNVRSEPRVAASTDIGDAKPGETLQILEERDVEQVLWLRSDRGWLMAKYTVRVPETVPGLLTVTGYSQNDARWKNDLLGYSYTTIANYGCLISKVADYMTFLGHPETPGTLNQRLIANGGYAGNNYYWNMPKILYGDVLKTEDQSFTGGVGFESAVDVILDSGRPVLAMVDYIPATSAFDQHWVLVIGKRDGVYYLSDPWDGTTQALHAKYKKIFRIVAYKRQ
jgi:hypothetical protein